MKTLITEIGEFQAEKIIKTATDIIGYDTLGNEIFSFKGISDFTGFSVKDGQTFDISQPTEQERITAIENALLMIL